MSDLPVVLPVEGKGIYEYLPLWTAEDDAGSCRVMSFLPEGAVTPVGSNPVLPAVSPEPLPVGPMTKWGGPGRAGSVTPVFNPRPMGLNDVSASPNTWLK